MSRSVAMEGGEATGLSDFTGRLSGVGSSGAPSAIFGLNRISPRQSALTRVSGPSRKTSAFSRTGVPAPPVEAHTTYDWVPVLREGGRVLVASGTCDERPCD